jgi:methylated-DNA-[protein]-cysteine S-methyltransferase
MMLEFADSENLERKIQNILPLVGGARVGILEISHPTSLTRGRVESPILQKTITQLREYFKWIRKSFDIPLAPSGTDFQKKAWKALERIPYGETRSYQEEAMMIGNLNAVRAIGWANNKNPIVIIIPCHRVIGKDGALVGYGWGIERKIWLLTHEKKRQIHKK